MILLSFDIHANQNYQNYFTRLEKLFSPSCEKDFSKGWRQFFSKTVTGSTSDSADARVINFRLMSNSTKKEKFRKDEQKSPHRKDEEAEKHLCYRSCRNASENDEFFIRSNHQLLWNNRLFVIAVAGGDSKRKVARAIFMMVIAGGQNFSRHFR